MGDVISDTNYAFCWSCYNGHVHIAEWLVNIFGFTIDDANNSKCIGIVIFEKDNRIVLRWILKTFPQIHLKEKWKETLQEIQDEDAEDERNFIKPCSIEINSLENKGFV